MITIQVSAPTSLWRADPHPTALNTLASVAYMREGTEAPMKYFTTQMEEIRGYQSHNPYTKQWRILQPLNVLNMTDVATRNELFNSAPPDVQASIDIAFPIHANGNVYRYSEEHTAIHDDIVLSYICGLSADIEGYLTSRQETGNGIMSFHSEVGVCRPALGKLVLENQTRTGAPPVANKRRSFAPPSPDIRPPRPPLGFDSEPEEGGPPVLKRSRGFLDFGSGRRRRRTNRRRKNMKRRRTSKNKK